MNQHTYKTHTLWKTFDIWHLNERHLNGRRKNGRQSLGLSLYVDENNIPVIAILADHFEVPSRTLCLTAFIWPAWLLSSTLNTSLWINLNTSQHNCLIFDLFQQQHTISDNANKTISYLINSNISGLSLSRTFILSFIAIIILLALSSAPCLELFSAAPN